MFVALDSQHAMRMYRIAMCEHYDILPHFLINGTVFEKQVTEHKMCVLIFSTDLYRKILILRRNERDMIRNVHWSSCKVPFIFVRF